MPVRIETSILDMNQDEVTASAHHEPQVCAVGDRSPSESKRRRGWKNHLNQRNKNSLRKLLKVQDSRTRTTVVNSSGQDRSATLTEDTLNQLAKNLANRDLSELQVIREIQVPIQSLMADTA